MNEVSCALCSRTAFERGAFGWRKIAVTSIAPHDLWQTQATILCPHCYELTLQAGRAAKEQSRLLESRAVLDE